MSPAHQLGAEYLRQIRDAAAEEVIVGVKRGADPQTLREFVKVIDQVDQRLDRDRPSFQRRQQLAAERSRAKQGI